MIHVCSLARLHDTVRETGARHVVTLIKDITLVHRPDSIMAENHLLLDMDDITDEIDGYVAPVSRTVSCRRASEQTWIIKGLSICHSGTRRSRGTGIHSHNKGDVA